MWYVDLIEYSAAPERKEHNGKVEVFNANLHKELFDRHRFYDLAEMKRRLAAGRALQLRPSRGQHVARPCLPYTSHHPWSSAIPDW